MRIALRLVFVSLLITLVFVGPHQAQADTTLNHYFIKANINYDSALVTADEALTFTNRTGKALDIVVLKVVPAYFDSFTLNSSSVNGGKVAASLKGVNLEVPLLQPLQPKQQVSIELGFSIRVPAQEGRFGFFHRVMALGNWFPILTVYRDDRLTGEGQKPGWEEEPYVDTGDAFFSEMANYDVTLTTSVPLSVAHTGTEVQHQGNEWVFKAENVRDFALAISDRYETISRTTNGIQITSFYLPEHRGAGMKYLDFADQFIRWADQRVHRYPYPTLMYAEVGGQGGAMVGQEYPNLIFLSDSVVDNSAGIADYLAYLVLHETAHQWFYGIVGNDQLHEPWLDEAMVTWLSYDFYRDNYPNLYPGLWNSRISQPIAPTNGASGVSPVDSSVFDFKSDSAYYDIVYRRGAIFLEELYELMGDDAFFSALHDYISLYQGRVSTGTGFLDFMQSRTTANLAPLISRYFTYPQYKQKEPLRVKIDGLPAGSWQSDVVLTPIADTPVQRIKAIDDTGWSKEAGVQLRIDTRIWDNGNHWLWLQITGTSGRMTDMTLSFSVNNQPLATPTAVPTPEPTATEVPAEPQPSNPADTQSNQISPMLILGIIIVGGVVVTGAAMIALLAKKGLPKQPRE